MKTLNKLALIALTLISFSCNALVGDTHKAEYSTTSLRILPNEIILQESFLYAIVEISDYAGVDKQIYVYSRKDCISGVGTLRIVSMDKPMRLIAKSTVFLSGASLGEAIIRDMCTWVVKP